MDIFDHLNSALAQARALQAKLDATDVSALHAALSEAVKQRDELRVYNANQQTTINTLDKELDVARDQNKQLAGQMALICSEHDRWVVKYQAAKRENETLRTRNDKLDARNYVLENIEHVKVQDLEKQIVNLQEFNDNQRKQLESLQKEMAAIHMCVVAASRSKLYDAMESYHGVYGELPFLLKAVATAAEKAFDSKDAAEKYASRIRAARHELES